MINLKNGKLIVTFSYDANIVKAVRAIPGREFNTEYKRWEVPAENVLVALELLGPFHFRVHRDVESLAAEKRTALKEVEQLKSDPSAYTGALPLYDFQKIGASFLRSMPGALLADVPGLGKTIQTIAALEGVKKILILCPASLKYSWQSEIQKWMPSAAPMVVDGDKDQRNYYWLKHVQKKPVQFTVANYELLLHDFNEMKACGTWDAIVCDEATRISNPNAKSVKALKLLSAKKKIALTGTPISNSPVDLYSIIDWLAPGVFGNYYRFLDMFCVKEPRFNRIVGFKNLDRLAQITKGFMLRRTKEEVLKDLPPKTVEDVKFPLSIEESRLYNDVREEIVNNLGDISKNLGIIPVKMLRLKQVTDDARLVQKPGFNEEYYIIKSSKLKVLRELLTPVLESGEKAIVFTQFAEMAKLLYNEFDLPYCITGDTPSDERMKLVDSFNRQPGSALMVMTEAGAYGLNLQGASYVVHYDMPWSVAKLMQREDRAHRMGQTKPVTVYNLIAKDTIDEYVAKTLSKKNKVSVEILEDYERLEEAGLNEDDIKAILRL